jgi:hypothetical protein
MNWLILSAFIQLGMMDGVATLYDSPLFNTIEYNPMYATLGVEGDIGHIFVKGSIRNVFLPFNQGNGFVPQQDVYQLGAGIRYKLFEIGWVHTCYHPVVPYMEYYGFIVKPGTEGGSDDFYVRFNIGDK